MICGIGIDIVDIGRLRRISDAGEFLRQVLTADELHRVGRDPSSAAKLFAAKEALLKALGCGLTPGWTWHDIEISACNTVTVYGRIQAFVEQQQVGSIHLSFTRSRDYSVALVLLER